MWNRCFTTEISKLESLIKEYNESYESRGMTLDAHTMYNFIIDRNLKKVLEIGVLHGSTTRFFALAVSQLKDASLTSVDIENQCLEEAKQKLESDGTLTGVNFVCSDSVKFLSDQPFNSWDLIFIDTDHTLKQTIAEVFLAGLVAKQDGGHIFLHDATMPDVIAAIRVFSEYNKGTCSMTAFKTESGLVLIQMEKK